MPAEYSQHGIRFLYPENWQLVEMDAEDGNPGLSLESPDGAFLLLRFFSEETSRGTLLAEMANGLRQQYEDAEISPCEWQIGPLAVSGNDALFYCLDFLVQSRMLVFDTQQYRVAAAFQAESRQFLQLEKVVEAILTGLVRGTAH